MTGGNRHNKRSSFNQIDQSERDISLQTNYAYAQKMQQLCLANNLMQVYINICFETFNCLPFSLKSSCFRF